MTRSAGQNVPLRLRALLEGGGGGEVSPISYLVGFGGMTESSGCYGMIPLQTLDDEEEIMGLPSFLTIDPVSLDLPATEVNERRCSFLTK